MNPDDEVARQTEKVVESKKERKKRHSRKISPNNEVPEIKETTTETSDKTEKIKSSKRKKKSTKAIEKKDGTPLEQTITLRSKRPNEVPKYVKIKSKIGIQATKEFEHQQLSGDDHSAHFPDKETGLYSKIDPFVEYTIFGYPYKSDGIWKPRPKLQEGFVPEVPKDVVVKDGMLLKQKSSFLTGNKWSDMLFKLKYCVISIFKDSKSQKPMKKLKLDGAKVMKDSTSDKPYSFLIIRKNKTWRLAAHSLNELEDWMLWIQAVVDSWKDEGSDNENSEKEPEVAKIASEEPSGITIVQEIPSTDNLKEQLSQNKVAVANQNEDLSSESSYEFKE